MKLKYKLLTMAIFLSATTGNVLAHGSEDSGTAGGMMMDGSMMHDVGHMTGYNMWGTGWFGLVPGVLIWILIILGIIYLFQQVTDNGE